MSIKIAIYMTNHSILWMVSVCIYFLSISTSVQAQRRFPQVEVKQLNGKFIDLSTIFNDNKPMVLFAWEVTCQPCIVEFTNISKVYEQWKKETDVKIVAVSVDDNRSSPKVKPLSTSRGWYFDIYLDPNQTFKRAMNEPHCPYAFILNGKGEVVWQKGGYTPGDEEIIYDIVKKVSLGEAIE
jgi:cytochrome c biogenesis protein CcmG/thiol:disulfide interchange protein DsbE